jgi:hypothetical protein
MWSYTIISDERKKAAQHLPVRRVVDDLSLLMHGSHGSISQHSLIHLAFSEEAVEHLRDRWKYRGIRGESGEDKRVGSFPCMHLERAGFTRRFHDLPVNEEICQEKPGSAGTYGTLSRSTDASRNAGEGVSKTSTS